MELKSTIAEIKKSILQGLKADLSKQKKIDFKSKYVRTD